MSGQLSKTLSAKSLPEARFIGIMAEYQALDGKVWRLALPFPDGDDSAFWQFWKNNDGELNARVVADINGLRVVKQDAYEPSRKGCLDRGDVPAPSPFPAVGKFSTQHPARVGQSQRAYTGIFDLEFDEALLRRKTGAECRQRMFA